jgi:hypothetical protein
MYRSPDDRHSFGPADCRVRLQIPVLAGAAAQRTSVLIAGPLGLCYLPTFLLGIVPVVAGLAGDVLGPGRM